VALSYCWGAAATLMHQKSNSVSLRTDEALHTSKIPATIRDAIALVQGVGERYLWVDALCIVQDDLVSKGVHLTQMGLIYSLATFTIIAAAGEDADAGLPGVLSVTRMVQQDTIELSGKKLLTVIDGSYYGGLQDSR